MIRNEKLIIFSSVFILIIVAIVVLSRPSTNNKYSTSNKIKVVSAENFWGSLVSQIGGNKVSVNSIVSDPNADPHEYESNTSDAKAFAKANYVILNGSGYDSWANKLLNANTNSNREVLIVANLLNKTNKDNPHFWYGPDYVNATVVQMEKDLIKIDPKDSAYYQNNLIQLLTSLSVYQKNILSIKEKHSGQMVSATEDIFTYLAQAAGLNLISPTNFMQAVSEGNDPPTSSVVQFQNQLKSNQSNLLVYNDQTVTPLTNNMKKLSQVQNIPIIGITETIQPNNLRFQDWMNNQVLSLSNALDKGTVGN